MGDSRDTPQDGPEDFKDTRTEKTFYCRFGRFLIDQGLLRVLEAASEEDIYLAAYAYAHEPVMVKGLHHLAWYLTHSDLSAEQCVQKAILLAVRDFPNKAEKYAYNFKKFIRGYVKQTARSEVGLKSNQGVSLFDVRVSLENHSETNPLSRLLREEIAKIYFQCQEECARKKKLSVLDLFILRKYGPKRKRYSDGYREKLARKLGIPFPSLRKRARRIRGKVEKCIERCFERHGYPPQWADLTEEKLFERDKDLSH